MTSERLVPGTSLVTPATHSAPRCPMRVAMVASLACFITLTVTQSVCVVFRLTEMESFVTTVREGSTVHPAANSVLWAIFLVVWILVGIVWLITRFF